MLIASAEIPSVALADASVTVLALSAPCEVSVTVITFDPADPLARGLEPKVTDLKKL